MALPQLIDDWCYRGEGNANLVIASKHENVVCHLLKQSVDEENCNKHESHKNETLKKLLLYKLDYMENVMMPLLGGEYVCRRELVEISGEFLQQVHQNFNRLRPKARLKTKVNIDCRYALKSPDFCSLSGQHSDEGSTFCIEIKPKCGFLPTSSLISKEYSIKKSVCRFCMHQRSKVTEGKWTEQSNYCPVDLFSGNKCSMLYALTALLSNPQNNFRIFKDGALLYGCHDKQPPCKDAVRKLINLMNPYFGRSDDDNETIETSSSLQSLKDVIITTLVSTVKDTERSKSNPKKKMKLETPTHQKCLGSEFKPGHESTGDYGLPDGCVLHRLLQVQKLDGLNIEGVYPLYQRLCQHFRENPSDREKWKLDGPYDESFLAGSDDDIPETFQSDVKKIKEYLVSKTVKDCSIMLALHPVKESTVLEMPFVEDRFGHKFYYKIQLADLDPKQFDRIPKYYAQDKEIVDSYIKETGDNRMGK